MRHGPAVKEPRESEDISGLPRGPIEDRDLTGPTMARCKVRNDSVSSIIAREAKLMKGEGLNHRLLEIFAGERKGSVEERDRLKALIGSLKDRIYTEAVYLLTHTEIEQPRRARKVYEDIVHHRNEMVRVLKRNVSMEVAALDYMQNVRNVLKEPTIIEADQYQDFVYRAILDETTQTYEKDLLDADIDSEIEKARRFGTLFSLLFLDLDDLKHINDTYGHEVGTRAIQLLSSCARKNLRKYDSIYRYGGDEFVILLPRADEEQACNTARRIMALLRRTAGGKLPESPNVSIGVATYGKQNLKTREALLSAADAALYEAKRSGKDAIRVHGTDEASSARTSSSFIVPPKGREGRTVLKGVSLVPGWSIGRGVHYHDVLSREIEVRELKEHELGTEMERILAAIDQVKEDLRRFSDALERDLGPNHAAIFDVHRTILDDADLFGRLEGELKSRMVNGEHVVRNVFGKLERQFRSSGSAMLYERSFDIRDIGRRLLRVLTGAQDSVLSHIAGDVVLFTKRLLPSDTIHFTNKKPLAIVTEEGGPNSHSALIARALGIPSVSGIAADPREIADGTRVVVDGDGGRVIIAPTADDMAHARAKVRGRESSRTRALRCSREYVLTKGKRRVKVLANVGCAEDVRTAMELGCDGIGLYRTEAVYMLARELPTEEVLLGSLSRSLDGFSRGRVVLRLADIGGDKTLPYLNVGREHASYLGIRGVRFLLHFPDFLQTQLRVFHRLAARHPVRILVPFVAHGEDMRRVRDAVGKAVSSLEHDRLPHGERVEIGAMIETPLAALRIEEILRHADFVSIGTNDLVQYLSAADRESLAVADYFRSGTESALSLVGDIIRRCEEAGKECTVCGDIAGDGRYTRTLLDLGLMNFSVMPPLIPSTKEEIHQNLNTKVKRKDRSA